MRCSNKSDIVIPHHRPSLLIPGQLERILKHCNKPLISPTTSCREEKKGGKATLKTLPPRLLHQTLLLTTIRNMSRKIRNIFDPWINAEFGMFFRQCSVGNLVCARWIADLTPNATGDENWGVFCYPWLFVGRGLRLRLAEGVALLPTGEG